jgi:general secretion pathway protein G
MLGKMCKKKHRNAFTLVELLFVMAIVGTLVLISIPNLAVMIHKARIKKACSDIAITGIKMDDYLTDHGNLPLTLEESGAINITDPWGIPYQYLIILGKNKNEIQGKWRKDRFMVPINSDFDLYSMGKDGISIAPLTAKESHDDIIRANNGDYIGEASKY